MKLFSDTSFISFEYPILNLLRSIEPKAIVYDLIDTKLTKGGLGKNGVLHSIANNHNISVRHFLASKKIIKLAHAHNLMISV
jgi:hypothetical protein